MGPADGVAPTRPINRVPSAPDAEQLREHGRGWYPYKPRGRKVPASEVVDAIYATPRAQGGKLGLRRYKNYERGFNRYWRRVQFFADREQSDAYAMSRPQVCRAVWPALKGLSDDAILSRRGRQLDRYTQDAEAAGYISAPGTEDGHGRSWRTMIVLLDPRAPADGTHILRVPCLSTSTAARRAIRSRSCRR